MPNIFEQAAEAERLLNERIAEEANPKPEPTPEPEPQPEPVVESEPEDIDEEEQEHKEASSDAKERFSERKAKRAEIEELRVKLAEQEARARVFEETIKKGQQQQQKPQQKQIDPNEDPVGALEYETRAIKSELESMKREKVMAEAVAEVATHAQELSKTHEDALEVIDSGFDRMCKAAKLTNPNMSEKEIANQVTLHNLQIAAMAHSRGTNPAEALYNYYKTIGVTAAPKAQPAKQSSETDKLKAVTKNKAKSGTPLVGGTSSSSSAALTAEKAMSMTPAQYAKLTYEERRSIFGE